MPAQASHRKHTARHPRVLAGTVYLTRQVHFCAAHRLHNPARSAAWNRRQYGLCANPGWHGHNYVLEVTVRGRPNAESGYLIDLGELKSIVHRAVIDPCDHRNLNTEVTFLRGTIPTTENLVIAFWREIARQLPPAVTLHRVRLYETPRNFADYYGPDAS